MNWPRNYLARFCPICGGDLHNATYEGELYRMCSTCQRIWDVTQSDRMFTYKMVDA